MSASPFAPARIAFTSPAVSGSPSSVTSMRKSSSASVPSPEGALPPTVAVTCGRDGRPARQVAGMRTTTPARSELRDVAEEAEGLLRRPAQRVEDLAGVDHLLEPGAALGRALHREQQREEPLLVGRARVLAQGLAERQVLGLAVRREPAGVGREEGERRLLVLAVLGEVEVHPPDDVPGRVQPLEEVLDRGLRLGQLARRRPRRVPPQSARSTSAVRYSAPGIDGRGRGQRLQIVLAAAAGARVAALVDVGPACRAR